MRDRDVGPRELRDLRLVDCDAMRAEELGREHPGERRDRALPGRLDQERTGGGERTGAVLEPLVLAVALGEVCPTGRPSERHHSYSSSEQV